MGNVSKTSFDSPGLIPIIVLGWMESAEDGISIEANLFGNGSGSIYRG